MNSSLRGSQVCPNPSQRAFMALTKYRANIMFRQAAAPYQESLGKLQRGLDCWCDISFKMKDADRLEKMEEVVPKMKAHLTAWINQRLLCRNIPFFFAP